MTGTFMDSTGRSLMYSSEHRFAYLGTQNKVLVTMDNGQVYRMEPLVPLEATSVYEMPWAKGDLFLEQGCLVYDDTSNALVGIGFLEGIGYAQNASQMIALKAGYDSTLAKDLNFNVYDKDAGVLTLVGVVLLAVVVTLLVARRVR
jgi:hypothetical protein